MNGNHPGAVPDDFLVRLARDWRRAFCGIVWHSESLCGDARQACVFRLAAVALVRHARRAGFSPVMPSLFGFSPRLRGFRGLTKTLPRL